LGDNIAMFFFLGFIIFFSGLELTRFSLKNMHGRFIEEYIKFYTGNLYFCIFTGVIITAILQSSSAVSIILISFIEAKLIKFESAIAIIIGANIGTTITVQILSLPILSAYFYMLIAGTFFIIIGKIFENYLFKIGVIIFSFALVFWGLNMMTSYFSQDSVRLLLIKILSLSDNIFYGIFLGGLITAIVQSSSIVTAITLSLARNDLITLAIAISISLGSNIGTCITAFLASINSGKKAKALAKGHFLFNLLGVIFVLLYYPLFLKIINFIDGNLMRRIANAHTFFNIVSLLIFLPFYNKFVEFLKRKINC